MRYECGCKAEPLPEPDRSLPDFLLGPWVASKCPEHGKRLTAEAILELAGVEGSEIEI